MTPFSSALAVSLAWSTLTVIVVDGLTAHRNSLGFMRTSWLFLVITNTGIWLT